MSDTPRTDAEWQSECCSGASWYRIAEKMKNRAADLERELAEVTKQRDELMKSIRSFQTNSDAFSELLRFSHERIAEVTKQRDAFRNELSKVMPPDYKDWWENDKNEWPLIARLTIENKRRLIDMDRETIERLESKLAEVTKQRDELLEALSKLLDKITDIRGIDIEFYAPKEIETAKQAIKKIKEKCNE